MSYVNAAKVADIVRDAGGKVVGRTRLQKIAYLLTVSGLEGGLPFRYKHYGPFSEEVATAAREASLLGLLTETEQVAAWGGTYSTYLVTDHPGPDTDKARLRLAQMAAASDAVELELAATAVFLAGEGSGDPWAETARRKPEKADKGRIDRARVLYAKLASVDTPIPLPTI